ncbi:MAG: GNAT family N-acetyltransferase [Oligoflexia bacterium]|nr:GNAT family N-acetyltransferase [Oligoflexia bacterium]
MLRGKKINLRLIRESDLITICDCRNDVLAHGEYFPMEFRTLTELTAAYKENGLWGDERGTLVITTKDDEILGTIGYFKTVHYSDCLELGAVIYKAEDRQKGYMTEATRLFCAYLFESKKIERLQATFSLGNKGSENLLKKCGFTKEGVLRKIIYHRGDYSDLVLCSVLRSEIMSLNDIVSL